MVRLHRVGDGFALSAFQEGGGSGARMGEILVGDGLSYVVEEPRPLCGRGVAVYFGGYHARYARRFNGMFEGVLVERQVEIEPAQKRHDLRIDARQPQRLHGLRAV